MAQGSRRGPGGTAHVRLGGKLTRNSVSKRKATVAKKDSGPTASKKTTLKAKSSKITAAKIRKKLQAGINTRIENELHAKATHDGIVFKVLNLKPRKETKKGNLPSKKNQLSGRKLTQLASNVKKDEAGTSFQVDDQEEDDGNTSESTNEDEVKQN